jgi:membrane protein required for colicin V production
MTFSMMNGPPLNGFDVIVLSVVGVSAVIGLARGLVREVLSLAIWLASYVIAVGFSARVDDALSPHLHNAAARAVASFALLFVGALVVGGLIQWLVGRLVRLSGLTGLDRLLGFVFGGARGFVIAIAALVMLKPYAGNESWWHDSTMIGVLAPFESVARGLFDQIAAVVRGLTQAH